MGYLPLLSYASRGGDETEAERPLAAPPPFPDSVEANHRDAAPGAGDSGEGCTEASWGKVTETNTSRAQENERTESKGADGSHRTASTERKKRLPAARSAKARGAPVSSIPESTTARDTASLSAPASAKTRATAAPSASGSAKPGTTTDASGSSASTAPSGKAPRASASTKARGSAAPSASGSAKARGSAAPSAPSGNQGGASEAARVAAALGVQRRAVLRLQRHLLEAPRCTQRQLAAAGALLTGPELDDVAVERALAQRCGNLLCGQTLGGKEGSRVSKLGQLGQLRKISRQEGAVYDARVLGRYCGSQCMRESQAAVASLPPEREGVMSAQELARVLLSAGCLPQGAAGTPQGAAGMPQGVADTSQVAVGTPQGAADVPQGAAGIPEGGPDTPQRAACAKQEDKEGAPVSSQSASTQLDRIQEAGPIPKEDTVQRPDPTEGTDHRQSTEAKASKAKPKEEAEVKGKGKSGAGTQRTAGGKGKGLGEGKGKGTASAEREWESSVMRSVQEKWGDSGTAQEGGRAGVSEEGRNKEKSEVDRSEEGSEVERKPQGESDAIEGYTPARRLPSHTHPYSPSHSDSHSSGGSARGGGSKKDGGKEVKVGAAKTGAGELRERQAEGKRVTWGPVQMQGQGDGSLDNAGKCPAPEGDEGVQRGAQGVRGHDWQEEERDEEEKEAGVEEKEEEEVEEVEEGEEEEEDEEEDWEGESGGAPSPGLSSGASPFRFGEYFWRDDCCWMEDEEDAPEAFLSHAPCSVALLLALQHIVSAETVLLLTTGVPLLPVRIEGGNGGDAVNGQWGGEGGGGGVAVSGGAPVAYQRLTRALAAADGGWEYAPRACPDQQRGEAIGRALTSCVGRALPGVLRDLNLSSKKVSLLALEAALRELVGTFSLVLPLPSFAPAQWRVLAALLVHALSRAAFPAAAAAFDAGGEEGAAALRRICAEASCPYESYLSLLAFLVPALRDDSGGPLVHPLPPPHVPGQGVSAN